MRNLSNLCVVILMAIALFVFVGIMNQANMWLVIALYWLVLTFKNGCDFLDIQEKKDIERKKNHESEQ